MSSTKILWRVQCRKSRAHKWVNKGLFETRSVARDRAQDLRGYYVGFGYGFGNTRVVRCVYFVEDVERKIPMRFKFPGHDGSVVVTFEQPLETGRRDALLRQKQIVRKVSA